MARPDITSYIGANARGFHEALRRVRSDVRGTAQQAKRDFDGIGGGISGGITRAIGAVRAAGPHLAAAAAAAGAMAAGVKRAVDATIDLGRSAKTAGVSFEAFQELKFVSEQNNVGVDALTDGLKELQLRADELVKTGAGPAAEAFRRLGFDAESLAKALKEPDRLFQTVIERMKQLDTAAQIRVADEIFGGTAGEQFVRFLDPAAKGIEETRRAAKELGGVLEQDILDQAEEINREFAKMSTTVENTLNRTLVRTGNLLVRFIDHFRDLEERNTSSLQASLVNTYDELQRAQRDLAEMSGQGSGLLSGIVGRTTTAEELEKQKALVEELTKRALDLRDVLDRRSGFSEEFNFVPEAKAGFDDLTASVGKGAEGIESYRDAIRALAKEIPGLAEQLAGLDARARIDQVWRVGMAKARTMGEVLQANVLRDRAIDAMSVKEATGDPGRYLRDFTSKPASHVTGLSSGFAEKLAEMLASAPAAVRGATKINSGFRSFERQAELFEEAVRKYGSEDAARKWVAPPGRSQHNSGNAADLGFGSTEARDWFHQNAGRFGLSFPMGHEPWHIEDAAARSKANDDAFKERWEGLREQKTAYDEIVASAEDFIAAQDRERQALSMTEEEAARLRYTQELLNEAERRGVEMTPERIAKLEELAAGMAAIEEQARLAAESQEQLAAAQDFLSDAIGGGLIDVITGATTAEDAVKRLAMALAEAGLQAALLGKGPLAGLFGGSGGGGLIGSLVGAIFGGFRKSGGDVSPGRLYRVNEAGEESFSANGVLVANRRGEQFFAPARHGRVVPADEDPTDAAMARLDRLIFGGARKGGGDVSPGRFYRVNEGGVGESFSPARTGGRSGAGGLSIDVAASDMFTVMVRDEAGRVLAASKPGFKREVLRDARAQVMPTVGAYQENVG